MVTYAKVLWQPLTPPAIAAVSMATLDSWFQAAHRKPSPRTWGEACVPYSAMTLSLQRIGWHMLGLASFNDHINIVHNVSAIGPTMLASLLRGAWRHRLAQQAASHRDHTIEVARPATNTVIPPRCQIIDAQQSGWTAIARLATAGLASKLCD